MKFLVKFFSVCFWTPPSLYILWALCSYLWSILLNVSGYEFLWSNYCLYSMHCEFHICWCCFEYFLLFFMYLYLSIFFSGILGERGSKYTWSAHHLIHYPKCIQSSPMKTFIQKMDSSSVANPTWYNNLSVRLRKPESRQIEGLLW